MLYLLPDQNITIALTFAGPADTTAITDVIATTLLAEKGVIPSGSTTIATAPQAAAVPEQLLAYAGYYTLSGNILKLDFNQAAGVMNLYSNSDAGFTLVDTLNYKDDGFFYGTDKRLKLEETLHQISDVLCPDWRDRSDQCHHATSPNRWYSARISLPINSGSPSILCRRIRFFWPVQPG